MQGEGNDTRTEDAAMFNVNDRVAFTYQGIARKGVVQKAAQQQCINVAFQAWDATKKKYVTYNRHFPAEKLSHV